MMGLRKIKGLFVRHREECMVVQVNSFGKNRGFRILEKKMMNSTREEGESNVEGILNALNIW